MAQAAPNPAPKNTRIVKKNPHTYALVFLRLGTMGSGMLVLGIGGLLRTFGLDDMDPSDEARMECLCLDNIIIPIVSV